MIGFVDVAMEVMLKNVFANDPAGVNPTVCWGPPEADRASMVQGESQADTGVPGLAVFRTGMTEDMQKKNQSRSAGQGLPYGISASTFGNLLGTVPSPLPTSEQRILGIPVIAEYTVSAYAEALSDLNDIEREMWFSTRYKALIADDIPTQASTGTVGSYTNTANFRWYMDVKAPAYRQNIQQQTGEIIWYGLTQKFLVSCDWIHTKDTPLILQVNVNFYNGMTSGDDISQNLLDSTMIVIPSTSLPISP